MSSNGCAFSSGGGTPEDASKAKLMALLFVTGREMNMYACLCGSPLWGGGWWVAESQAGEARGLVSPPPNLCF